MRPLGAPRDEHGTSVVHPLQATARAEPKVAALGLGPSGYAVHAGPEARLGDGLVAVSCSQVLTYDVPIVTQLFDRVEHAPMVEQLRIAHLRSVPPRPVRVPRDALQIEADAVT